MTWSFFIIIIVKFFLLAKKYELSIKGQNIVWIEYSILNQTISGSSFQGEHHTLTSEINQVDYE